MTCLRSHSCMWDGSPGHLILQPLLCPLHHITWLVMSKSKEHPQTDQKNCPWLCPSLAIYPQLWMTVIGTESSQCGWCQGLPPWHHDDRKSPGLQFHLHFRESNWGRNLKWFDDVTCVEPRSTTFQSPTFLLSFFSFFLSFFFLSLSPLSVWFNRFIKCI
jgi:hypothetical protein